MKKRNNTILIILLVVLIASGFMVVKSNNRISTLEKESKEKDSIYKLAQDSIITLNDALDNYFENDSKDSVVQYNYYNDFLYERNRNRKLQKKLDDIRNRQFDRAYLDSLAEHVRFY